MDRPVCSPGGVNNMDTIRLLVVDDSARDLAAVGRIVALTKDMEIVGSFEDPKEAAAAAKTTEFDVAVVDYRMPIMDGVQLAEKLKIAKPHCKVVVLTAYDDDRRVIEADINVDHFHEKIEIENLEDAIRRLVDDESALAAGGRRGLFGRRK
jgi:DNA-binding NarL/FixJ family response regulator